MDSYPVALSKSAKDFLKLVYPKIHEEGWMGDGELVPVEAVTENNMATLLDQYASIDAWYIKKPTGIRGLASRVQRDSTFNTFTIRKTRDSGTRTEFEKLCFAIDNDWVHPYWFCQAYIYPIAPEPRLYSVALCETKELINYIRTGRNGKDSPSVFSGDYYESYVSSKGAATFYVVPWPRFQKKDYFFRKWDASEDSQDLTLFSCIKKTKEEMQA